MKKIIVFLTVLGISLVGITVVFAKSEVATIQSGKSFSITKADTTAELTTSVKPSYVGRTPFWITNQVYRKKTLGIFEKAGEKFFAITELNKGYPVEYTLVGVKDTKSTWINETENAAISATFYINNGHDSAK